MKYKILTVIPTDGKKPTKLQLLPEGGGEPIANVAVWSTDWPNKSFSPEQDIEGVMEQKDKVSNGNTYKNFTLKPLGSPKTYSPNKEAINKAMERKETSIGKFQDNKEASIKTASTFSSATQLTCAWAEGKGLSIEELKEEWSEFRDWLIVQYDVDVKDLGVPFKG